MENTRLPAHLNHYAWNRKILNVFWVIILVSVCVEVINSFLSERPLKEFYLQFVLLPTFLLSLTALIAEWSFRRKHKYTDYTIIGAASLFSGILVGVHSEMFVMYASLFFPMLISAIYFDKKKVWVSFTFSLSIYLVLSSFHPIIKELNDLMAQLTMASILLISTTICIAIMSRGYEIAVDLKKAQADHQDLMVKSTIMEKQVKTDALTGLYNHMAFYEYMDVLILQAETYHHPLHLAVIDIDNFKKVNDTYGHGIGDLVLKRIAKALKENVSTDDFVARYGGEEFVIILNDVKEEIAFSILDNIRKVVQQLKHPEIIEKSVTISVGLQTYRAGMHKQAFFEGADNSLYVAKRQGKNRVIIQECNQALEI
ncbi:GGDEF domain-containing protein [Fictibacillus nanhaiensis]|uniref:GGDEF domain-containing protein n=1 Tax=Fictibacillus nanhaiensis TaxID=742169 RepID=UPI001C963D40|nr:GGDEF domain-containing protein [Fictibacillus nanhaiensis]MBY6036519.1 GGDEF domain-containing protein [Fictibacillus nanhaiensis]